MSHQTKATIFPQNLHPRKMSEVRESAEESRKCRFFTDLQVLLLIYPQLTAAAVSFPKRNLPVFWRLYPLF